MNDIVVDMLNLSKLEKEESVNNEDINCKPIILDIVESLKQNLDKSNISIELNIEDVILNIDEKLAYQLFKNLIENAIKYNKENGFIKVYLTNEVFVVEDSGVGISEYDQNHVFERFYRVDKAKSKSLGGTGLGLAIVKHICENYGYNIILKSTYNVGTRIEIKFNK